MKSFTSRRRFVLKGVAYLSSLLALSHKFEGRVFAALLEEKKTTKKHYLLNAEQEQGPFYIDHARVRSNITDGRAGVPLTLKIRVVDPISNGAALIGAVVDIWHCDSGGEYSGFAQMPMPPFADGDQKIHGFPPPGGAPPMDGKPSYGGRLDQGPPHAKVSNKKRFLRGVQITDADGCVEFQTIYPGWYVGRAIHIHLKVQTQTAMEKQSKTEHIAHTGQLFFPEEVSDEIMTQSPYCEHKGERTRQSEDMIFAREQGEQSMVALSKRAGGGLIAKSTLGVNPAAVPSPVGIF